MASEEANVQALVVRLAKLEKQNRRMKQTGVAVLVVGASLAFMGQASKPKTVEANEFVLRDGSGIVRARLWVDEQTAATQLRLFDEHGKDGVFLSSSSALGGAISLRDSNGAAQTVLTPLGVSVPDVTTDKLSVVGNDGKPRSILSMDGLYVGDDQGFSAQLGVSGLVTPRTGEMHRTSAASLVLFDKKKNVIWKAP